MRFVAMILLVAALAAPAALAAGKPHVTLAAHDPAVVRGAGFAAHEQVTVSIVAGAKKLTAKVTTTASGVFVARWTEAAPAAPGCRGSVAVTAVGAKGDRAGWKSPLHLCTPIQPIGQ